MKYILIVIFFLAFNTKLNPCTIFFISDSENCLVGNNEDNLYNIDYYLKIVPASKNNYGRIELFNKVNLFINNIQGGMNEKGLFFDMAGTPNDNIRIESNPNRNIKFGINTIDNFLATCKNVEEAVIYWKSVNWGSLIPSFHMLIADQNGKSVILEWVNGEMISIEKKGNYQIITNYLIKKPWLPNSGGWDREDIALGNIVKNNISINNIVNVLKSTSQQSVKIGTIYSNIYDLKKMTMMIFLRSDDSVIRTFDLLNEFKKGKKVYRINSEILNKL
jgi:hypothetical protein